MQTKHYIQPLLTPGPRIPSRADFHREFAGVLSIRDFCTYAPGLNRKNAYTAAEQKELSRRREMKAQSLGRAAGTPTPRRRKEEDTCP